MVKPRSATQAFTSESFFSSMQIQRLGIGQMLLHFPILKSMYRWTGIEAFLTLAVDW